MKEEAKREKEIKWKSEKDKKEFKGKKIKKNISKTENKRHRV